MLAALLAFSLIAALFAGVVVIAPTAYAADDPVKIIAQSSFIDSENKLNVVGTIRNTGYAPVQVTMGLNVKDENGNHTVQQPTYGRIVWPLNDSPFKFVLESGTAGEPFIMDVQEAKASSQLMLMLNYTSMAAGEDRAFVGTVKNTAPFDLHNVSIFASVRSDNWTQLDTIKSDVIPVLKPGEEQAFVAKPDPSVRSMTAYFSCAGVDFDAPITTINAGGGRVISYDLQTVAQISSLRYENATDSIAFGIRPYNPAGGPLSLKIPQFYQNQTLNVMMDGQLHDASIKGDGRTMYINFFVPKGDHEVEIQGVRNVPELPSAAIALAAVTAAAIAAVRFKAAFKVL
jgi:hypothetical protein